MEQNKTKGIYLYAMEYAIYLGLLFIIKLLLSANSSYPFMALLAMLVLIAIPVLGFVLTRKFRNESGCTSFIQIFFFGLMLYFFASLLSGIFEYVYYQYINNEFFQEQLNAINKLAQELTSTGYIEDAELFNKELPLSPIAMVYQGMWGTLILGAIYSLVLALILRKKSQTVSNNQ